MQKHHPKQFENALVARRAADLRVAGNSWGAIAEDVGYKSGDHARMAVKRYFQKNATNAVEEMRPILQERGEYMWRLVVRRVTNSQSSEDMDRAIDRGMRVLSFQARINGLMDRPPQVSVSIQNQPDVQDLRQQFVRIAGLEPPDTIDAETVEDQDEEYDETLGDVHE